MDFLLIAFLTLLNGVFAMSELALTASRKARLMGMADDGDQGAAAALLLLENPTRFLSSVQVGITSIGVLNGIIGEAAFSGGLSSWLQTFHMATRVADISATALVVTVITFTTIVFGELVPKRIGQLYPEQVSRVIARPMTWVASIAKPFVWLLSASTHGTLKMLRIDNAGSRAVTEAEISASLEEGVDAGVIEEQERQMVQNVFLLDDRPLTSMMLPRSDIKWLDAGQSAAEILEQLREGGAKRAFSWYPVCRGSLENVVGTISLGKLIELGKEHSDTIESHVHPPVFVPETLSGMELLEQFRVKTARMVLVVDEYGDVQGLITPNDLLEAITGELQPYTPVDAWATPRDDGSWLIDGAMPVGEFKARLDIAELPDEERGRYNTVAGLLMAVSGSLPAQGDKIECAGWMFEVIDLDGRRIDKMLATRLTEEQISQFADD
ncbi:MAG: HlyC/CorC family transporter [Rhodoferax sp.]|nr:HlyC/CorC family transporter [Rhodoferax sp.]HQX61078.1 hemolysin family protein [Burkholderiaceae bacterium]HQZ05439.1 hemolysin family protein [Burkholderiaceae bacterium]